MVSWSSPAIRAGPLGYLAGPCETWSKAREVAAEKVGDRRNYGANRA